MAHSSGGSYSGEIFDSGPSEIDEGVVEMVFSDDPSKLSSFNIIVASA